VNTLRILCSGMHTTEADEKNDG